MSPVSAAEPWEAQHCHRGAHAPLNEHCGTKNVCSCLCTGCSPVHWHHYVRKVLPCSVVCVFSHQNAGMHYVPSSAACGCASCIVAQGNGPISSKDRESILEANLVVRFNWMHHRYDWPVHKYSGLRIDLFDVCFVVHKHRLLPEPVLP